MKEISKRITIQMYPDYGNALFWDEEGASTGGCDVVFVGDDIEINLSKIEGLVEWFYEWHDESLRHTRKWNNEQWKKWWNRGLELAKQVKTLLPDHTDLYYFTITDKVWEIKPEDTDDGGIFDEGEPILIE